MKCEICHKRNAETALTREDGEELYVCTECARGERVRRQKRSQSTRRIEGLPPGVSMSVTEISGAADDDGNPPPIIGAIMNAFNSMVDEIGKPSKREAKGRRDAKMNVFPLERADPAYRIGRRIHLEGLYLLGDTEGVRRAADALGIRLAGVDADGVKSAGHVYSIEYSCPLETARRYVSDLLRQEDNARRRLVAELPRVLGDSVCRALAILKNCRLLSPGELFDLMSPMMLASMNGFIDGIALEDIRSIADEVDLWSAEDAMTPKERDEADAERADAMNRRFGDVVLSERGEDAFL